MPHIRNNNRAAHLAVIVAALLVAGTASASPWRPRSIVIVVPHAEGSPDIAAARGEAANFTRLTGIPVDMRADDGTIPADADIIESPSPAFLNDLFAQGRVIPASSFMSVPVLRSKYGSLLDSFRSGRHVVAVPVGAAVKSTLWARKDTFTPVGEGGLGLARPSTWDELMALTDVLAAGEGPPWLIADDSGWSGWPLTDWIESILVKSHGVAVYNRFFTLGSNRIPFTDARMKAVWRRFGAIARDPQRTTGGVGAILGADYWFNTGALARPTRVPCDPWSGLSEDACNEGVCEPLPGDPPAPSRLMVQASFLGIAAKFAFSYVNCATGIRDQLEMMPIPAIDPAYADSMVIGAGGAVLLRSRPSTKLLASMLYMYFYTDNREYGKSIVPHGDLQANRLYEGAYPADTQQVATSFYKAIATGEASYDGSDLLPAEAEQAFRENLVLYLQAPVEDADEVLDACLARIEAAIAAPASNAQRRSR